MEIKHFTRMSLEVRISLGSWWGSSGHGIISGWQAGSSGRGADQFWELAIIKDVTIHKSYTVVTVQSIIVTRWWWLDTLATVAYESLTGPRRISITSRGRTLDFIVTLFFRRGVRLTRMRNEITSLIKESIVLSSTVGVGDRAGWEVVRKLAYTIVSVVVVLSVTWKLTIRGQRSTDGDLVPLVNAWTTTSSSVTDVNTEATVLVCFQILSLEGFGLTRITTVREAASHAVATQLFYTIESLAEVCEIIGSHWEHRFVHSSTSFRVSSSSGFIWNRDWFVAGWCFSRRRLLHNGVATVEAELNVRNRGNPLLSIVLGVKSNIQGGRAIEVAVDDSLVAALHDHNVILEREGKGDLAITSAGSSEHAKIQWFGGTVISNLIRDRQTVVIKGRGTVIAVRASCVNLNTEVVSETLAVGISFVVVRFGSRGQSLVQGVQTIIRIIEIGVDNIRGVLARETTMLRSIATHACVNSLQSQKKGNSQKK
jgi:hypothetical protein